MIAIVDYGAGNLRSVRNALQHLGAQVVTISRPEQLQEADKIILPGVGAFGAGMAALREGGFVEPIQTLARTGIPLLGICLGMQYLFESSEEMGQHQGLGLLKGHVRYFGEQAPLIPHIGWNQLHVQQEHPLLKGVESGSYAYFVHSYYVQAANESDILATTDYGIDYASVVGQGNIFGIQCHPEKSQAVGLHILRNFVEWEP
ncbi:MAG: imidazole glycerol phosphate synthase subunit HisH [Anaerolineales bacterium]|nr:imidazole glycerol phosphate synthase subunit HisH [Anaerolineales bacterium]